MALPHGLPSTSGPLARQLDRRYSQNSPTTATPSDAPIAPATSHVAIVQTLQFTKQQEANALAAVLRDNGKLLNSMSHAARESENERKLRLDAETLHAELSVYYSDLKQTKAGLDALVNELQGRNEGLENEKTRLEGELESEKVDRAVEKTRLTTENEEAIKAGASLRDDIAASEQVRQELEQKRKDAVECLEKEQERSLQLDDKVVESFAEMKRLRDEVKSVREDLEGFRSANRDLHEKLTNHSLRKKSLEAAAEGRDAEIKSLKQKNVELSGKIEALSDERTALQSKIDTIPSLNQSIKKLKNSLQSGQKDLDVIQKIRQQLQKDLDGAITGKEKLSESLNLAQLEVSTTKNTLTKCQEASRAAQNENNELEQRWRKIALERDAVVQAKESLATRVKTMGEVERELRENVEQRKQEIDAANLTNANLDREIQLRKKAEETLVEGIKQLQLKLEESRGRENDLQKIFNDAFASAQVLKVVPPKGGEPSKQKGVVDDTDDASNGAKIHTGTVDELSMTLPDAPSHEPSANVSPVPRTDEGSSAPLQGEEDATQLCRNNLLDARSDGIDASTPPATEVTMASAALYSPPKVASRISFSLPPSRSANTSSPKGSSPLSGASPDCGSSNPRIRGPPSDRARVPTTQFQQLKRKHDEECDPDRRHSKREQSNGGNGSGWHARNGRSKRSFDHVRSDNGATNVYARRW